jgi:phosphotransferase system  glucose/maltose/N-acetylglucosamine-specific IIC component
LNPRRREKEGKKRRKCHANFGPWGMYLIAPLGLCFFALPFNAMILFLFFSNPKEKRKKKKEEEKKERGSYSK